MNSKRIDIDITLSSDLEDIVVIQEMKKYGMKLGQIHLKDLNDGMTQLQFEALIDGKLYITDVYNHIKKIEGVLKIEIKGL